MTDLATFEDKYGDQRTIHKTRHGLRVKRGANTPVLQMNPVVAAMIGQRVRVLRQAQGWTLAELATRCGMIGGHPKERMWEIETAKRGEGIRLGTLYALAIALGVEATDLLPSVSDVRDAAEIRGLEMPRLTVSES